MDLNIKEKIIDAAQSLFIRKGYDNVTMREIAGQCGIAGFFASEYAFHHFIVHDPAFYRIYIQVINSPTMRLDYYKRHLALFLTFVEEEADSCRENAIVVMSSLEFQLMETGAFSKDFDGTFSKLFQSTMIFLEKNAAWDAGMPEKSRSVIETAIKEGRKLADRIQIRYE